MQNNLRILFIGDIIGKTGRDIIKSRLKDMRERLEIDFVIANGENLAGGFGMSIKIAETMLRSGIDAFTSGNHIWDNNEIFQLLDDKRVLRPLNYDSELPGKGFSIFEVKGAEIMVVSLNGRIFMQPLNCPFRTLEKLLEEKGKNRIIIVDIHAEASAEKQALGYYFDSQVTAVIGTHTHVQTADERILPGGTAFITDAGMTGAMNGVIGFDTDASVKRTMFQVPQRLSVATENPVLSAVLLDVDTHTKKPVKITRILEYVKED